MNPKPIRWHDAKANGFALVATISMLVILTTIAVGFLGLAAVSLKSSSLTAAEARARANARMALMIAIDRLQAELGPDQRISANGAIIDKDSTVNNPHWLGVWDSWKAGINQTAGGDSPSAHSTIEDATRGIAASYEPMRENYFRSWLVSLNDKVGTNAAEDVTSPKQILLDTHYMPASDHDSVVLVGKGSLGGSADPDELVKASLIPVTNDSSIINGRFGWWVGDESQKASIMSDPFLEKRRLTMADSLNRHQAPASMGHTVIDALDDITNDADLDRVASRKTLRLVEGVKATADASFHDITTSAMSVLADVREGGLKRDLSTLLEQEIDPGDVYTQTTTPYSSFPRASKIKGDGDDYMLYRFDNLVTGASPTGEANVPIQDLAAYYQLYDHKRSGWKGGIQYSSNDSSPANTLLTRGVMVSNPDFGTTSSDYEKYLRQYTALYRTAVPVKLEFVLHYFAEPIQPPPTDPNADRYYLRIGFSPAITFWNPNNVPLVMNLGNPEMSSIMIREHPAPIEFVFRKSNSYGGPATKVSKPVPIRRVADTSYDEIYTLFVSGNYSAVFQPGECKVFALRFTSNTDEASATNVIDFRNRGRGSRYSEPFVPELELVPGWDPMKFARPSRLITANDRDRGGALIQFDPGTNQQGPPFTFRNGEYISAVARPATTNVSNAFGTDFAQKSRHGRNQPGVRWDFRSFKIGGRMELSKDKDYRDKVVHMGFPDAGTSMGSMQSARTIEILPKATNSIISAMQNPSNPRDDLPMTFFYYGMKSGVEAHELQTGAFPADGTGRRFPSRPFLHSSPLAPSWIESINGKSLYNHGWNWFFQSLDNLLSPPISISNQSYGYWGGGYTASNGTTHIVQQHLPLTPPISIAALSHAHLGGFSLATESAADNYQGLSDYSAEPFRRTTAVGFGGLAPHTIQAIGNSYAHPNIPAEQALHVWNREYKPGTIEREPFADHSYLANKALWDEFFFSSITPRPRNVQVFETDAEPNVEKVASGFFFSEEELPNRRITPYLAGMDEDRLNTLMSEYSLYKDGFADKIAANLMVNGGFNINSTSVEAWKALFSSLKGKEVAYFDTRRSLASRFRLSRNTPDGVPVAAGAMPNGEPYTGGQSDPSDSEQWQAWRELTDDEIDSLARAMVRQVKLRGPFLSLSEFVNRRLDRTNPELSAKGALQAAIDDDSVTINEAFRNNTLREFSNSDISIVNPVFREAMEGPIAYGSSAYVDQADILRNFAAQLTPRGDTFVIRTYGDALDATGKVEARAWCEATIQRLPEYVDPADAPHTDQHDLTSEANKGFGRKFAIVQFRWLNPSEI